MSFDRRLITRAVTNLVKNASEAVRDGAREGAAGRSERQGRVETIVTPQADRVTIEVIDNGIGLPKQNRARLLEPYVTTKGHKGTGLGLAMVQKITEQHGGDAVPRGCTAGARTRSRGARPHHPAASQRTRADPPGQSLANRTSHGPPGLTTTKEL